MVLIDLLRFSVILPWLPYCAQTFRHADITHKGLEDSRSQSENRSRQIIAHLFYLSIGILWGPFESLQHKQTILPQARLVAY
jgi:hypothetical protein